jgi:hypothetical protein
MDLAAAFGRPFFERLPNAPKSYCKAARIEETMKDSGNQARGKRRLAEIRRGFRPAAGLCGGIAVGTIRACYTGGILASAGVFPELFEPA